MTTELANDVTGTPPVRSSDLLAGWSNNTLDTKPLL